MSVRRRSLAVLASVALLGALATSLTAETAVAASGNELGVGDAAVWEGDAGSRNLQLPVTMSQPAAGTVTVTATFAGVSATNGTDFKVGSGLVKTLTFSPGQTLKYVTAVILPDTADEVDESISVTLSTPTGGATLGRSLGSGTILDDDPGTGARLGIGDASVVETDAGAPKLRFWATLSQPTATAVQATVEVTGMTANAGSDFKPITKSITIQPGRVKTSITVTVYPDAVNEPDETAMAMLSNVTGAAVGDDMGVGTVIDDDASAEQTATFTLGPFSLSPMGTAGSESEATQANIPKPSGAFGLTGIRFDVTHTDGTPEGHHNVHLHHVVLMDTSRADSLCGSLPNRFAGSGAERTPVDFGSGEYAYKVGAGDQWNALWHIMNTSTATHTVYIEYEIDYVTGADLAAAKPLRSYFYDVDNCWGDSEFNVPGTGGPGSVYSKTINYTAARNGVRLFTGGHLHDGGIDLILKDGGVEACRPTAMYEMDMLHQITYCTTPSAVSAGDSVQLTARYSNEQPITGAMGISVSYVWEP